jgi:hypothetical protein
LGTAQLYFDISGALPIETFVTFDAQNYLKDKWYLVGFGYDIRVGDIKAIYPTSVVWIMENSVYQKLENSTTIIPAGQGFWFKNKGERISASSSSSGGLLPDAGNTSSSSSALLPGNSCTNVNISGGSSMVYDCAMQCVDANIASNYTGDKYCDNGSYGFFLNCPAFNYDGGDCFYVSSSSSSLAYSSSSYSSSCGGSVLPGQVTTCSSSSVNWSSSSSSTITCPAGSVLSEDHTYCIPVSGGSSSSSSYGHE